MAALRGVNLGGWLVAERWITPSLFAGTDAHDEYTLSETAEGRERLRTHHQAFLTEEDFRWIRDNGLDIVRIPVGYWIAGDAKPFVGAIDRLDWAFRMARKYDLEVLLCLHAAPGSQNGEHHSGQSGDAAWFRDTGHRARTFEVLVELAERYADHERFWGLELLNEPRGSWRARRVLRKFYRRCYRALASRLGPQTRVVFSDAFRPRTMSGVVPATGDTPVMMDVHWYHFGTWGARILPLDWYYRILERRIGVIRRLKRDQEIIVGEWSGALAQRVIDRYPKDQHRRIVREHVRRQLQVYSHADAWCYWTYKHEHGGIWGLRSLVEDEGLSLLTPLPPSSVSGRRDAI